MTTNESLSGCVYAQQLPDESWESGEHIFDDEGKCFNCNAKKRPEQKQEKNVANEIIQTLN